jgi:hypothetical protein
MLSFFLGFGAAIAVIVLLIAWYGSGPVEPEERQTFNCPECGAELEMADKDGNFEEPEKDRQKDCRE